MYIYACASKNVILSGLLFGVFKLKKCDISLEKLFNNYISKLAVRSIPLQSPLLLKEGDSSHYRENCRKV